MAELSTSKLTRDVMAQQIADQAELSLLDARHILEIILDGIVRALRSGDKVEIRGFGSFRTRTRKPHLGRNPRTGAAVSIPPRVVPHFKASKELLALVNWAPVEVPPDTELESR
jgi:integration host factor subunit beta